MITKTVFIIILAGLVGLGIFPGGPSAGYAADTAQAGKTLYTCGMHPQVIQDHPGNCPICGMKLTPVRKQVADNERKVKYYKSTMNAGETSQQPAKDSMGMEMVPVYEDAVANSSIISIDPVTTQNMGIRTGVVTKGPLRRLIRTVGTVEFNETAVAEVTTKFKGWIEKLYVDSTGQQVHRGDPLFEIYSPELFSAQTEYIVALDMGTKGSGSDSLKNSAMTKLKFMDISEAQIMELERTRQPHKTLQMVAPIDGFVTEKMVVAGQMMEAGTKIYRIADLATVWVLAQFYEQDLPYLKLGQEALVKLSYLPDREFRGRVTYIYPTLDEKTRTVRVRMEFHNPGFFLKPGMFTTVEMRSELEASVLLVPDMAILRSGEKNTVFVALDGGKFEPRTVTLGPRGEDNLYQILSGLNEGERVVTSGQFMLDSESQLREAIQKMLKPSTGAPVQAQSNTKASPAPMVSPPPVEPQTAAYICPMPEHVSIRYDHPGKCPLCGMTLIPVSEKTLDKVQPGGKVEYYTCPMTDDCPTPGHGNVHYEKAGKCPVCGMTLVPVMETPKSTNKETNAPVPMPALYTCPMASHADVVLEQPGECPKCGMTLVPTGSVAHGKIAEDNWRKQHAH